MNTCVFIDECLTPELVGMAFERGYEAIHVVHMGLQGAPDWKLLRTIRMRDTIFATNNRRDFLKLFGRLEFHNGLIVIVPAVSAPRRSGSLASRLTKSSGSTTR